jgi:hypothetical protein
MMLTRIGLDHPEVVGWTRELSPRLQAALGVDVDYWRTRVVRDVELRSEPIW